jgi:hypothetical protein
MDEEPNHMPATGEKAWSSINHTLCFGLLHEGGGGEEIFDGNIPWLFDIALLQ